MLGSRACPCRFELRSLVECCVLRSVHGRHTCTVVAIHTNVVSSPLERPVALRYLIPGGSYWFSWHMWYSRYVGPVSKQWDCLLGSNAWILGMINAALYLEAWLNAVFLAKRSWRLSYECTLVQWYLLYAIVVSLPLALPVALRYYTSRKDLLVLMCTG